MSDSATPCTVAYQAPLYMGSSRQEYWSGWSCSPPRGLPNSGIEPESPVSLVFHVDSLPTEPPGKPISPLTLLFFKIVLSIITL